MRTNKGDEPVKQMSLGRLLMLCVWLSLRNKIVYPLVRPIMLLFSKARTHVVTVWLYIIYAFDIIEFALNPEVADEESKIDLLRVGLIVSTLIYVIIILIS